MLPYIQLATCVTGYSSSVADAADVVAKYNKRVDDLLIRRDLLIPPNAKYDLTILSAFNFEVYYEADLRECMRKHYLLTVRLFPALTYEAPLSKRRAAGPATPPYRVGVMSGFLRGQNSVNSDFGGMLRRLPSDLFTLIFFSVENKTDQTPFFWVDNAPPYHIVNIEKGGMDKARKCVQKADVDLLLYLDSTMSGDVQQMMMSRLAPVQAVSHGHPVTSGIPSSIMDFFVSWGAAELPTAQNHYTERLKLLPAESMHQYYLPRVDSRGHSVVSGKSMNEVTRESFPTLPPGARWYMCMQKPFKVHPVFDDVCKRILDRDPTGILILHEPTEEENQLIFKMRYASHADRVFFLPHLSHEILMGLYKHSDVVLDSMYAGGCTTTREALEVGAPVVTLPTKYLGGRWSLAYYTIMDYMELVARDEDHYVELAVTVKTEHKEAILERVSNLFYRQEAIESWTQVLIEMIQK